MRDSLGNLNSLVSSVLIRLGLVFDFVCESCRFVGVKAHLLCRLRLSLFRMLLDVDDDDEIVESVRFVM